MPNGDAHRPRPRSSAEPGDQQRDEPGDSKVAGSGDTAPSTSARDDRIGETVGKYRIVGLLGRGGMGVVYRAHDDSLSRDVALKILPADLAADATVRERFLSEAKSAAQVWHPNVVSIFEVGQHGATYFIAMELVAEGNVEEKTAPAGAYSSIDATRIVADACRGLAAAHKTGLIHRDIKPANLLRTSDGTTKLADFGLAKGHRDRQAALTRTGHVLGTPYYMSPEQCQSKEVTVESDVYSLGATYFTLLTGRRPYHDAESDIQVMFEHCHGAALDPRTVDARIPADCGRIVTRATAKNPADRYRSAEEMLADLERVQARLTSSISTETVISTPIAAAVPNAGRWTRRRAAIAAGILAVVLAFGFGIVLYVSRGESEGGAPMRGVTGDAVVFGTTTAYSGANEDLGRDMVLGIRTCFDAVNAAGGVGGRQLKLVVLDDGYEPEQALDNMRALFDEHQVFGVIGNVGTPTAKVAVPYAVEHRYLFFAPFSGASFMRGNPPERYVYHFRAGYADETAALVKYFVETREIPADRIAVFAQNDSYGDDGFEGVTRALRRYGVRAEDVPRANYDRNSIHVAKAVEALSSRSEPIEAVIMVATYKPAARFVKEMKERGGDVQFAALSFVGSEAMSEEFREIGPEYADGVIVTQVVPFFESSATGVIRYRDALRKYHPESRPGFVSLEGFIAAQCLVEGLKRVEGPLSTESLIDALDSIQNLDLGIGPVVSFGPSKHQVSDHVWGTVLDSKANFRPLDLGSP